MFSNSIVVVALMMSSVGGVAGQGRSDAGGLQSRTNSNADYLGQKPPGVVPELFAPGIVSTGLHEHSAVLITPNGNEMFFTVADGPQHVILHVRREKNGWQKPKVAPFSGQYKEDRPFLGPHGQRIYYSSRRPQDAGAGPEEVAGTWYVERNGEGWSEPKFDPVLTAMGIATPGFAVNGNLYFCSSKRGGLGREDIFVAKWVDGSYSEPKSLGESVNSEFMEAWLFVDPNERYIIFTSVGRPEGTGLYISFRDNNGKWTEARNLGPTINQSGDERFAWVSHDGKYLFFNRQWGKYGPHSVDTLTLEDLHDRSATPQNGRGDVYWVDASLIEKLKR